MTEKFAVVLAFILVVMVGAGCTSDRPSRPEGTDSGTLMSAPDAATDVGPPGAAGSRDASGGRGASGGAAGIAANGGSSAGAAGAHPAAGMGGKAGVGGSPAQPDAGNADLSWKKASLTGFNSYPDPDSEECVEYNGCMWAGMFAAIDGKQTLEWVMDHNIAAVHSNDFKTYKLKTLRLRQGQHQIDVKVYDQCADSDCSGCCTRNAKPSGFLIDIEHYTAERFGVSSGQIDWACLDCP